MREEILALLFGSGYCQPGRLAAHQDEFNRMLGKASGDYAARALGLLTQARQAK